MKFIISHSKVYMHAGQAPDVSQDCKSTAQEPLVYVPLSSDSHKTAASSMCLVEGGDCLSH